MIPGYFDASLLDRARPHVRPDEIDMLLASKELSGKVVFGNASTGEDPTKVESARAPTVCAMMIHAVLNAYLLLCDVCIRSQN